MNDFRPRAWQWRSLVHDPIHDRPMTPREIWRGLAVAIPASGMVWAVLIYVLFY